MPEALVRSLPTGPSGDISPDAAPELVEMAATCAAVLVGPWVLDVEAFSALLRRPGPAAVDQAARAGRGVGLLPARSGGDRLAGQVGGVGFLARELPSQLPLVLSEIKV